MSIIERAIKKSQAAGQRSGSSPAGERAAERARGRAQRAASIDPSLRIRAPAATVDRTLCRERRLLLQGAVAADGAAVAAYRMLRTRLLHRAQTNNWTTIAVTSAGPNEGKTLTALNLALSMAREKSREVVLLDMDMRNPSVCRTLGVHPPHELREYLEGGDHLQQLFLSLDGDNLLIAGSTSPTEHASELLASPRFGELLHVLRQGTVDPVVLIDLPPLLITDDALVVAPKVDAVLVVASQGVTGRSELARALNLLSDFPVAGVVFNRAAEAVPGYGYGYGYGYGQADRAGGAGGASGKA